MRFSILAFAALAVAEVQTVLDTVNQIQAEVKSLDTAINAWSGGSPQAVIDSSKKVIALTTSGATTINNIPDLTVQEAAKVQAIVQKLTDDVKKAIDDLVAKKEQAVTAQYGGLTYQQLQEQSKGAQALSEAITNKVPASLKQVAKQLSNNILANIQKGVEAFSSAKDQAAPPGTDTGSSPSTDAAAGGAAAGAAAGAGMAGMAGMNSTAPRTGSRPTNTTGSASASAAPAAGGNTTTPVTGGAASAIVPLGALVAALAFAL